MYLLSTVRLRNILKNMHVCWPEMKRLVSIVHSHVRVSSDTAMEMELDGSREYCPMINVGMACSLTHTPVSGI